jgi:transposase
MSRDRSKDSARGATDGAPQAQQEIDRWHVLKNLREAIERLLSHTPRPEETKGEAGRPCSPRQKRTSGERVRSAGSRTRRLALYQQVNALYQHGGTILGIARQLQIGAQTVRKFVRSPQFPEWGKPAATRSAIDPYRTYLEERWRQGCQDAGPLWRELQARGFTGSRMMVYRWMQVRRDEPASVSESGQKQANRVPRRLAPRHLAWLFLRDPDHLKKQEKHDLSVIRISPSIDRAYELSQQFVTMLKERDTQPLASWLRACHVSEISDLVTFAQSLELEGPALKAAFALPWSNGPVEGKINKLKYIKRSMYGRSGFPLLRQKVLKAG